MAVPPQILDLLFAGESQTLEFKSSVREPAALARLIAGFANADGGRILVGVTEPPAIVGVDRDDFSRILDRALALLEPAIPVHHSFVQAGDAYVADISVARSEIPVLVRGSAFIRSGSMTRPMEWTQLKQKLPTRPPEVSLEDVFRQSQRQTELLEQVLADNEQLRNLNEELRLEVRVLADPKARNRERWIGAAFGVGASIVASIIIIAAAKQFAWLRT